MILCATSRCKAYGRHATTCGQVDCKGCLPRRAADGRNLCEIHTHRIAEDATTAGELHAELEQVLSTAGIPGAPVSGTRELGLRLNPRAVECRDDIRAKLVSWCLLIAEERGFTTPADEIPAIAAYVATNATWLSAHPLAFAASDELHELAHGLPWRTAYPEGARRVELGPCPQDGCAGVLAAYVRPLAHMLPSTVTCSAWRMLEEPTDPPHEWPASSWHALGRAMRRAA